MWSALEKALLSAPVAGLGLPALIDPDDFALLERALTLGWDREDGIGELIFDLRVNGVVVIDLTPKWVKELIYE